MTLEQRRRWDACQRVVERGFVEAQLGEPAVVRVVQENRPRLGEVERTPAIGEVGGDDAPEGETEVARPVELWLDVALACLEVREGTADAVQLGLHCTARC